jgi:hypothetical protein
MSTAAATAAATAAMCWIMHLGVGRYRVEIFYWFL